MYLVQNTACSLFTLTLILLGRYVLDAYLNTTHNISTINKKCNQLSLNGSAINCIEYTELQSQVFYQNIHPP